MKKNLILACLVTLAAGCAGPITKQDQASLAQPIRCWQARRHVSAYLDGELDETAKSMVEGHLAGCPTCPPLYASLVGVRATLGGLRDPDSVVEAEMAGRIRAQVEHLGEAATG